MLQSNTIYCTEHVHIYKTQNEKYKSELKLLNFKFQTDKQKKEAETGAVFPPQLLEAGPGDIWGDEGGDRGACNPESFSPSGPSSTPPDVPGAPTAVSAALLPPVNSPLHGGGTGGLIEFVTLSLSHK